MIAAMMAVLTAATAAQVPADMVEPDPKAMTPSEIRAHNAKLPATHPYFIRCVKVTQVGSLVARRASCRTNNQWHLADEAGNREARNIADQMSSKAMPTN